MADSTWSLLTGEYPPDPGGVSDYTRVLARALAVAGDRVEVWAPESPHGPAPEDPGVMIRPLVGLHPGPGLRPLERALAAGGRRLLVQFVPHALGLRGVNLPLCAWLARRRPWVMFHEVHFPWTGPLRWRARSALTVAMAAVLASGAARSFVSIAAWIPLVARLDLRRRSPSWAPVPSNLPTSASASAVAAARAGLTGGEEPATLVGHFGTHGAWYRERLAWLAPSILAGDARRRLVLLGRGAEAARLALVAGGALPARVVAPAVEAPDALAAHIAACDLLVEPYPDGVSARRGSTMAGLALGVPVLTNVGRLTDPTWVEAGVATGDLAALPSLCAKLLGEPATRQDLARRGAALYEARFAVEHTVAMLRRAADEEARA